MVWENEEEEIDREMVGENDEEDIYINTRIVDDTTCSRGHMVKVAGSRSRLSLPT